MAAPPVTEVAPRGPGLARVKHPSPVAEPADPGLEASSPASPFQRFLAAMVRTALAQGATHVAAELPAVLGEGRIRACVLEPGAQRALQARGYLAADGAGASATFARAAQAWRSVLEGGGGDLSACGDKTLDEWGSALLASLLGRAPQAAEELRRALRGCGVAAFGMREAA